MRKLLNVILKEKEDKERLDKSRKERGNNSYLNDKDQTIMRLTLQNNQLQAKIDEYKDKYNNSSMNIKVNNDHIAKEYKIRINDLEKLLKEEQNKFLEAKINYSKILAEHQEEMQSLLTSEAAKTVELEKRLMGEIQKLQGRIS